MSKNSLVTKPRREAERVAEILTTLARTYPDAHCALHHRNAFELTVATILSAQCTDERVNKTTPALFREYPDAPSLASAKMIRVEELVKSTGFYKNKARSLVGMAKAVMENHKGEIPSTIEELTALPGIGRKTANVVLGNAFGIATGIVVDTHVKRLAFRMGLTKQTNPEKVEIDLMKVVPKSDWVMISHRLIFHGRRICVARKPRCETCPILHVCPRKGLKKATSSQPKALRA